MRAEGARARLAIAVYAALGVAGLVWGWLSGRLDVYHHPEPWLELPFPGSTAVSLGAGLAVAALVIVITRILVRNTRWARQLHVEFRSLLGPLTGTDIAVFALTSGVAEELFFRGAMQPSLGLVASSLIFGLVHMGPVRRFWPWTIWAVIMGFVFAVIYQATGELLGCVVAHVLINYENLHFIDAFDPEARRRVRDPSAPRLVRDRVRSDSGRHAAVRDGAIGSGTSSQRRG